MGKIIQLYEHTWETPPLPTNSSDVLFSKEKPVDQFWRRQEDFPDFFYDWYPGVILDSQYTARDPNTNFLMSLNREDTKTLRRLRDREMYRRKFGVWFMNNGVITYLTGSHYFFLQWCKMQSRNERTGAEYGDYREFQAHLSYFMRMCKDDPDCSGAYILKPKKTGVTQFLASDFVEESTRMRGRWFGIMSKTLIPDCRDTNFGMYKHCFQNMPNIFKPTIANENLTMMFFGNPVTNKNAGKKSQRGQSPTNWLNTRVTALPTTDDAFDGGKPYRAWLDEFPKYEDPYPESVFTKTKVTVKLQDVITGKQWYTSYTPEKDNRGMKEAFKVWCESLVATRSKQTGRTKNEMYAHFISVLDSSEGTFDRYGVADVVKSRASHNQKIADLKGDKDALQAFHRTNPTTAEEAWRAGGGGVSYFENIRLGDKYQILEKEKSLGHNRYVECNLVWSGKKGHSEVVMHELTAKDKEDGKDGLFRIYGKEFWREKCLNRAYHEDNRDEEGYLMPPKDIRFVGAMDPTNYIEAAQVTVGSNNSIWVGSLPDPVMNAYWRRQVSKKPVLEYLHRHNKPEDTYDDLKKVIMLFGCPIIIEGNMPMWATKLIEDGFQNFLLIRDTKNNTIVPYNQAEHKALITTQRNTDKATINDLIAVTQEYLGTPREGDFDNLENVDSMVLIDELMRFNPLNTKEFDTAMGFMYMLLAMECFDAIAQRLKENSKFYSQDIMEAVIAQLELL